MHYLLPVWGEERQTAWANQVVHQNIAEDAPGATQRGRMSGRILHDL